MDREFIMRHLISGWIPAACALALYAFVSRTCGNRQKTGHFVVSVIFCFYLTGILVLTGICLRPSFSPRIVYLPFADMISAPLHTFLNILLFIPLGLFLPVLYAEYDRLKKTVLTGFLISLSVETVQMLGYGISDINDLITNTAGACLGFFLYRLLSAMIPAEQIRMEGPRCYFELLLFWTGSLSVMLTVQIPVFSALFSR